MVLNLNELIKSVSDENDQRFPLAKAEVQLYLQTLNTVKIFIATSRNFGHQSSSINILFNMIRLGCNANFIIVYQDQDALNKLKVLLPIDPANPQPLTFRNSTDTGDILVTFLSFTKPQADCDLALTGGYDNGVVTLSGLNAKYIIELQPYDWKLGQNAIYVNSNGATVDLDVEINNFNKQAFYIENPTRNDAFWAQFPAALPSWNTTVNLTTTLLNLYGTDKKFLLAPMYGINTGSIDPILALFNMCCGISYQQSGGDARKAVIVSFSPVSQPGQDNNVNLTTLKGLIDTGKYPGKGGFYDATTNCLNYLTSSQLATRVQYYSGTNPQELSDLINGLKDKQILVVQIGPVPAPIFNYTYYMANLPFVFEGQNTATLAMNFGRAYLQLTTPGAYFNKILFPNVPVGNGSSNNLNGEIATMISSKLSTFPSRWTVDTKTKLTAQDSLEARPQRINQLSPAYVLGKYAYDTLIPNPDNKQTKYFKKIEKYFHDEKYDKLLDALIYLNSNIINP
ncbi:hypothetical protein [Flavobacterium sp. N502540]|uniref:hypothetical protein n=1 Tax=Flavobacterium sp. N502540 TaxID=2986838 RepID=UPI002224FE73|nr:hypothetical protein [Flavobacterium sp. N502540]